ncbi:MAG: matrixin family metalloprotease [Bryobacterales bacterium]|nr:matrixin family metalloprotease [Bryobacterales bacterium]
MKRWIAVLSLAAAAMGASATPALYWRSARLRAAGNQSFSESHILSRSPGRLHSVLQFDQPLTAEGRRRLSLHGVRIVGLLPPNGYVISRPAMTDRGVLPPHATYLIPAEAKLSPQVAAAGSGNYIVSFHPDVPAALARSILHENHIEIRENPDLLPGHVLISASREQVDQISKYDEVAYVFPASQDLVDGTPTAVCGGPITLEGPIGQYVARIGEGWDGQGPGNASLRFAFLQLTSQLDVNELHQAFKRALANWSNYAQIDFTESAEPYGLKTLAVLFARGSHGDPYPFDGPGNVLAHTFYPAPANPEPIAGDLHFDEDEDWNSIDFFSVALHELGHALGLGHSDQPAAVMYPYYKRVTGLNLEDIDAIRQLYAFREPRPLDEPAPPAGPSIPAIPEGPADPADPALPVNPTGPSLPATPGAPSGPVMPPVPSGPAEPSNPVTPAPPDNPATPSAPTAPGVPSTPSVPSTPTIPATPDEPRKPGGDTTAPSLSITYPFNTTVGTMQPTSAIRGVAFDNTGVTEVSWSTNDGQTGVAQGTTFWSIPSVKLRIGITVVTICARDAAGNTAWRSLVVTRI